MLTFTMYFLGILITFHSSEVTNFIFFALAPPAALNNVTVLPSTVLALIQWNVIDDGGYPILNITVRYRESSENSTWHYVNSHVLSHTAVSIFPFSLNFKFEWVKFVLFDF